MTPFQAQLALAKKIEAEELIKQPERMRQRWMDYGTIPNLPDDETDSMLSASAVASVRIPLVASSAGSGSEATTSKAPSS